MPVQPFSLLESDIWQAQFDNLSPQDEALCTNLYGSTPGLLLSQLLASQRPYLIITRNQAQAHQLHDELRFFSKPEHHALIHYFPDWETLTYDRLSPHPDLVAQRIKLLCQLPRMQRGIIITSLATCMQRLQPACFFHSMGFELKVGAEYSLSRMRTELEHAGYNLVDQVNQHGEYAVRGAILDFFATGSELPIRVEWFDNEIESLRYFDHETQRSLEKITQTELLAAREYPLDDASIDRFRQNWRQQFSGAAHHAPVYQHISDGQVIAGAEYYLPLFFEKTSTLFDYLPENCHVVQTENLAAASIEHDTLLQHRYSQLCGDLLHPICPPDLLYLTSDQWQSECQARPGLKLIDHNTDPNNSTRQIYFASKPAPKLNLNLRKTQPIAELITFLEKNPCHLLLACASPGREETMRDFLRQMNLDSQHQTCWQEFVATVCNDNIPSDSSIHTCQAALNRGIWLPDSKLIVLTEHELFANFVPQNRRRRTSKHQLGQVIDSLQQLAIGDAVVHQQHGIGRYRGLQIMTTGEHSGEFMVIEYAENSKVYVPIQTMHLVTRYIGADAEHAPLHHLGRKQWQKAKEKTAARIRDVAAELLEIYSKRQAATGFAFPAPATDYRAFCAAFPFEETPDQAAAIDAVCEDMCQARCMDRLVCGDVGFGKTEVAMRAAFLAVIGGKQVAMLVPTTLLANQHTRTFIERMLNWPIKIACLSRLQNPKQQQAILEDMACGKVDIVIATHKLLSASIRFKNLGLLIIDEEHRFGVKQKDRLKAMRAEVDVLTLTATPIPRTLNLALTGTRDLSIIATAPNARNAIQTFVRTYNPGTIKEALKRELQRGGQAYYLHNKVSTIESTCQMIQTWLPDAKVRFAHGQMHEGELEDIMRDFYQQQFNVLVSTTIIESGIDIPSANTIIIERADRFGLAELHQLRGRVGRSHHQAYAYLLTPDERALTRDARKRLDAISNLTELGAGFNLASQDLEIRGAGELLGENQSGQMHAVGFSLYMQMLQATVKSLQTGKQAVNEDLLQHDSTLDLPLPCLLPEKFIHDVQLRLDTYKRLTDCTSTEELRDLKAEIIDRFGPLPQSAHNLWHSHTLRLTAAALGLSKIEASKNWVYYIIKPQHHINHQALMQMLQAANTTFTLQGSNKLRQQLSAPSLNEAQEVDPYIQAISETLHKLKADPNT